MKILELAEPGPLRDSGVSAILAGTKTAMTGLPAIYEKEGEPLPAAGERYSVIDSDGKPAAVIELTRVATNRSGQSVTRTPTPKAAATATPPTGGPPTRTSSAATSWPSTSASCPTSTATPSSSPSGSG
jgi:hypothetical protein